MHGASETVLGALPQAQGALCQLTNVPPGTLSLAWHQDSRPFLGPVG